jgi:hypothetical protein
MKDCLCCQNKMVKIGKRECPLCHHIFKGKRWEGIDAHWKAKHLQVMPYKDFLSSLCDDHGLNLRKKVV